MTHARHLKATADPADLRAAWVRAAHNRLYRLLIDTTETHPVGLHEIVLECQRECLEALEEAEVERERVERRRATG